MTPWQVSIEYLIARPFSDEDTFTEAIFDALDHIVKNHSDYGAVGSGSRIFGSGGFLITVDAQTAVEAAQAGARAVMDALTHAKIDATIIELITQTPERFETELNEPKHTPVIDYTEIAEIEGVTRARAGQFAKYPTFPAPVIMTAQGPLYDRAAVLAWLKTRPRQRGRRKKNTA